MAQLSPCWASRNLSTAESGLRYAFLGKAVAGMDMAMMVGLAWCT